MHVVIAVVDPSDPFRPDDGFDATGLLRALLKVIDVFLGSFGVDLPIRLERVIPHSQVPCERP